MDLSKESFFNLEKEIRKARFITEMETIKSRLLEKEQISASEFAERVIFVILAGGFKQKTAKSIHETMIPFLQSISPETENINLIQGLLKIFNNKNKVNAIAQIWQNREKYHNGYKSLENAPIEAKLLYLSQLPHIGKITKNHLARNLGEDVPKYDIWVQRLGVAFSSNDDLQTKINNAKLHPEIKKVCDVMFEFLKAETGLPIGYIDYVLWRACEQKILGFPKLRQYII